MICIRASPPDKEKDASTRPVSINSKEMDNQPLLRKLAHGAVLQSWWKLLDSVELKKSSISFFDIEKHESAISRWSRARTRAAKVGKGLSKNDKAQKLALQHWLEAIDPRHRYGHNLHFYHLQWLVSKSREPFFYWLDIGEGKEANLEKCPRSKLQQQCIKYLGPMERKTYEVVVKEGKLLYKESGELLHTTKDAKWIFVLSTSKSLYVGKKMKGKFQHSSFLAGGVATAAGRLVVDGGVLKAVWPHSGHYLPTEESFKDFLSFLSENNVDLTDVKTSPMDEEDRVLYKHLRNNSSDEDLSHAVNDLEIEKGGGGGSCLPCTPEEEKQIVEELNREAERDLKWERYVGQGLVDNLDNGKSLESQDLDEPELVRMLREGKDYVLVPKKVWEKLVQWYKGGPTLPRKMISQGVFNKMQFNVEVYPLRLKLIDSRDDSESTIQISKKASLQELYERSHPCVHSIPSFALLFAMDDVVAGGLSNDNMFDEQQEGNDAEKVPDETIMEMINSKKGITSYQLGSQVSRKWTTGAGPRSSCVRDCPSELQFRARTHSFPPRKGNHWPR
ncbi:IQ DOMAIN-CONTAINING PROTEIN IQM6 [Salix viminalis]|uniref:IQ DOMAIN-CONTAINING PROTEIN IQM6 n=1 Tax=Salix viminalis TaxID=40686 RepID=A0A9Q0TM10_SALVM|nr:IQ DOMAIN-CONTAINING PROTEIN IQM6 [Salix viminalis]